MNEPTPTQTTVSRKAVRQVTREELTNLPNILTMMRIALIPPVMMLLLMDTPKASFIAALLDKPYGDAAGNVAPNIAVEGV